jgi:hypothetical protein
MRSEARPRNYATGSETMQKLELALLVGAAIWINLRWDYFTPRPKHAWHHRAEGRAHRGDRLPGIDRHRALTRWAM